MEVLPNNSTAEAHPSMEDNNSNNTAPLLSNNTDSSKEASREGMADRHLGHHLVRAKAKAGISREDMVPRPHRRDTEWDDSWTSNDTSLSRTHTLLTDSENSTGGMLVAEAGLNPWCFDYSYYP